MKTLNAIVKILAALAAVAGVIYVIAVYGDRIVVILGGGIMAQEAILRPRLEQALAARLPKMMLPPKGLAFAQRQNDAGMLGALYLLQQKK